jgi:DNA gyrase inhibitor GyrI
MYLVLLPARVAYIHSYCAAELNGDRLAMFEAWQSLRGIDKSVSESM